MNREIRFRAWDKKNKAMRQVCTLEEMDAASNRITAYYYDNNTGSIDMIDEPLLMQFTGLLDKNGKEIYDGDIVKYDWKDPMAKRNPRIGAVEWYEKYCDYRITTSDNMWKSALDMLEFEIIGNIYEHPSLLDKNN